MEMGIDEARCDCTAVSIDHACGFSSMGHHFRSGPDTEDAVSSYRNRFSMRLTFVTCEDATVREN
jgi:hypothetical protein